jgi:hypothetical protein
MMLNQARRVIVGVGAIAFALMGVYPPWIVTVPASTFYADGRPVIEYPAQHRRGYSFVYVPPEEINWLRKAPLPPYEKTAEPGQGPLTEFLRRGDDEWSVAAQVARIDWSRLVLQWLSLAALIVGGYAIAGDPQGTRTPPVHTAAKRSCGTGTKTAPANTL